MIRADDGQNRPKLFLKLFTKAAAALLGCSNFFSRSSLLGTKANGANSLALFNGKVGRTTISIHLPLVVIDQWIARTHSVNFKPDVEVPATYIVVKPDRLTAL